MESRNPTVATEYEAGTVMSNAIRSALWLGFFVGSSIGSLMGAIIILASYPYIEYLDIIFASSVFFLLGMFATTSVLFAMEYWKAKKSGMLSMWADYTIEDVFAIAKEYGLRIDI